jgi:hypothetical protein
MNLTLKVVGAAALAGAAGLSHAAEGVEIHGFANQNYLRSTSVPYKDAGPSRDSFDEIAVALLFTAPLGERIKAWTLLHMTGETARMDWAFVDYRFNAALVGRAGRIKLPVGFYNEIIAAKFLQLSTEAPFLYQGPVGLAPESFDGVALNTQHQLGATGLTLDLYMGQTGKSDEDPNRSSSRLTGGRVSLQTPVPGLRFMASAYSNQFTDGSTAAAPSKPTQRTWVVSAEYKDDRFDIKSEYGRSKTDGLQRKTWYVQGGYSLTDQWQPYVRWDQLTTDTSLGSDPSYYQKDLVVGLNYSVNSSISVRAEKHTNRGYGLPVAADTIAAGDGKPRWSYFTASVNFIF